MGKTIKASKIEVLKFIAEKEVVEAGDLMSEFGLLYRGAVNRIYRLEKQNLIEKLGTRPGAYCLTNLGYRRLEYDDAEKRKA